MSKSWFELRVHGVSGTPPESMLDFARVRQVAGDEFGRFFRRIDEHGSELTEPDGHSVEAYHWGKFTSGSWSQALWLLIAPFGVVNAAQFMLEPPTSAASRLFHTVTGASLRIIGLALTALFVLGTAVITVDLWSWQLVGDSATFPQRFVPAVALLGPVAVVALLYFFGRAQLVGDRDAIRGNPYELGNSARKVERQATKWSRTGATFWDALPPTNLTRPGFFAGDNDVPALRWLHVGAGLSMVALLGFAAGQRAGLTIGEFGFGAALVTLVLILVTVIFLGDPAESASIDYQSRLLIAAKRGLRSAAPYVSRSLAGLAMFLAAAAIVFTAVQRFPNRTGGHYPEVDRTAFVVMVAAVVGVFGLIFSNAALAFAERNSPARAGRYRRFGPYAKGMACTLVTSVGLFVAVGYVGAFALAAATFLDSEGQSVEAPEILKRVVYAWGITAVMLVVLGIAGFVHRAVRARGLRDRIRADFTRGDGPTPKSLRLPDRWVRRAASGMWMARLKNHLVFLLVVFAVVGILLSLGAALELAPMWSGEPTDLGQWIGWLSASDAEGSSVAGFLMWLGGLTLTGLATLLVFLGRTAILGEATRRGVNVVWDVIAFWPRSVHPMVPPAYSQRSVADIRGRLAWHLGAPEDGQPGRNPDPSDRLVLCGHSQGSLLSFTALVTMGGSPELKRLGLVTFGSQLQVMFARAFPAFVNYPTIAWLYSALDGRWRNLYRDTDHMAGPVLSWNHRSEPIGRVGGAGPDDPGDGESEGTGGSAGTDGAGGTADGTAGETDVTTELRVGPPPDLPDGPWGRYEYGADWRLLDPPLADHVLQKRPLTRLRRHSDYWQDDAWPDAVRAVLAAEKT